MTTTDTTDPWCDEETQRRLPITTNALRKVARALKAAGWTPEEADHG